MPWRPSFIYQSTSPPSSVTLSPDPPCSLHLASSLIDFLHKHLIFLSTLWVFILLLYPSLCYSRWHSFIVLIVFSFPLTVLQEFAFQLSFDLYQSILANSFSSNSPNFFLHLTRAWMQKGRTGVCSHQHLALTSPNWPWLQGWWLMFINFNFSKLLHINEWWNKALVVNTGQFLSRRKTVTFSDCFTDVLVCCCYTVSQWGTYRKVNEWLIEGTGEWVTD